MNAPFETELTHGFVVGKIIWIRRSSRDITLCVKNQRGSFHIDVDETQVATLDIGHTIVVSGMLYSCFRRGRECTRIKAKTIEQL